jgi:hypothetical protein
VLDSSAANLCAARKASRSVSNANPVGSLAFCAPCETISSTDHFLKTEARVRLLASLLFPDAGVAGIRQFATAVYPTVWNASAARNTVPSSQWRPISIMPTGSPADMPAGTVTAGWPVTSNGQVLEIMSSARAT